MAVGRQPGFDLPIGAEDLGVGEFPLLEPHERLVVGGFGSHVDPRGRGIPVERHTDFHRAVRRLGHLTVKDDEGHASFAAGARERSVDRRQLPVDERRQVRRQDPSLERGDDLCGHVAGLDLGHHCE